jgi:hypothetical protein
MRVFVLLVALGVTPFSPLAAAAASAVDPSPTDIQRRVRAVDARVREAIVLGMARSAAFREVMQRVEARDVIVYIQLDPEVRGRLAGRMRWVAATNGARYVRVSVNPELTGHFFVATLAHELEHVAEVGDAPSIVDEASLQTFYRGVGSERHARSGAWDTVAAQLTGDIVRKELATAGDVAAAPLVVSRAAGGQ